MKIYIYTVPKAGTYFLADFVARLGFNNTGLHISRTSYLDTARFDLETNIRFPSRAKENQPFMKTLRGLKDGDLAFGHFPLPLMPWLLDDFFYVCAYRHPRRTLVSEFIDFRFRREDVPWISATQIPDDRQAFVAYLERQGQGHMATYSQMIGLSLLRQEPLCRTFHGSHIHILNFDDLLAGPAAARALADDLGAGPRKADKALADTRAAETKTKATGLAIDRDALWSDQAEQICHDLGVDAYVQRGRALGWTI